MQREGKASFTLFGQLIQSIKWPSLDNGGVPSKITWAWPVRLEARRSIRRCRLGQVFTISPARWYRRSARTRPRHGFLNIGLNYMRNAQDVNVDFHGFTKVGKPLTRIMLIYECPNNLWKIAGINPYVASARECRRITRICMNFSARFSEEFAKSVIGKSSIQTPSKVQVHV
jgi:hypothetical protein